MRNIRAELELELRHPIRDAIWTFLEGRNYVDEVVQGISTVSDLAKEVRLLTATWGGRSSGGMRLSDRPDGAAVSARIDALSAIYAAWADSEFDVRSFRSRNLVDHTSVEFRSWVDRRSKYPDYQLLAPEGVAQWVLTQHNAQAPDGDGDQHVRDLYTKTVWQEDPTTNLWYIADRQERILTVETRSPLGDLATLAEKLGGQYRWRPSEAATFVLTGRIPEVMVYTGSAPIRYGSTAATTRVTMVLDPFLTPEQVAGIYSRLKAQLQPSPPHRSRSVRSYRLAQHIGPYVASYVDNPRNVVRPGRPPRPGPSGLAHYLEPVKGHTWQTLRRAWNDLCGSDNGRYEASWSYNSASTFIRDAKTAWEQLLFPGWERPSDLRTTEESTESG